MSDRKTLSAVLGTWAICLALVWIFFGFRDFVFASLGVSVCLAPILVVAMFAPPPEDQDRSVDPDYPDDDSYTWEKHEKGR